MNIGNIIGSVVSAPFKAVAAVAKTVTPVATELLRTVLNTGFEAVKFGAGAMQMMGPLGYLMNPMMALAAPMIGQGAAMLQGMTNQGLSSFNSMVQGRPMPMPMQYGATAYPQQMYPPQFDQRYSMPGGFAGQYGNQAIFNQMYPGMPGSFGYPQMGAGTFTPPSMPINPSAVYGSNAATATSATLGAGFLPSGNEMFDLANSIANAPTYSPTEQALLSKIKDPEQRAIQELQMQMQKQALLATTISNLANMRHEMLKAVANNLRS